MKSYRFIGLAALLLAMTGLFWVGCSDDDTVVPSGYTETTSPTTGLATGIEEEDPYGDDWDGIEIQQDLDSNLIWDEQIVDDGSIVDPLDKGEPDEEDPGDPKDPGGTS